MGREFEIKLRVPSEETLRRILQDPSVRALAMGEDRQIRMESTYFDTADRLLARRRWTLRRRRENERSVVTVKTPAPGRARGEWETEGEDLGEAIPRLCALGAPAELPELVRGGVVPRCGAQFVRTARMLSLPGGTVAELAADHGILTGGGRQGRLVELEVELKEGKEQDVERFCSAICEKYDLVEEPLSKFARASRLAEG